MREAGQGMMFVRRTLYNLKRKYGAQMDIYKTITMSVDQKTGRRSTTRVKYTVKKCILLPVTLARKITIYVISRTFPYGGEYDTTARIAIVDATDFPKGVTITNDDYCIIKQREREHRYEIKTVEQMEGDFAYILSLKETVGAPPQSIIFQSVGSRLHIEQTARGDL
jgi:hypothetical protein